MILKGSAFLNCDNALLTLNYRVVAHRPELLKQMIKDFLAAQKDLLAQAEERLEIYRDKLDKVNTIKDDLKSHIQSLPDLTQLPDVTGGLAPLPSAGDLFTVLR